jgi:HD-GYP domain-containing protein (c-di-GMP phosphodiesterase class II)/ABC-type amino acid transport substrate-binding protein
MTSLSGHMHTTIRFSVVAAILFATILTASLAIGLQYYFGQAMAKEVAADLYSSTSSSVAGELRNVGRINANIIDLLADNPALRDNADETVLLGMFTQVLLKNPLYYGIYFGADDGSFFEVINLNTSETARKTLHALPTDRWLVITVGPGENGLERHYRYLDENFQLRLSRSEPTDFDVRSRPWYVSAIASDEVQYTDPYIFAQLGVPGQTLSKRLKDSRTVVAIDMTMATISEFLREPTISEHGDVYLFTADGQVMASSLNPQVTQAGPTVPRLLLTAEEKAFVASQPVLRVSNELNWPPLDFTQAGQPQGYSVDVIKLIAQMTGLQVRFTNGYSWPELLALFQRGEIDLLQSVILTENNRSLGLPGSSYLQLPFAVATAERYDPIKDLAQLNGKLLAIPAGWSIIPLVRARYPLIEIVETATTLQALEMVLAGKATAALDSAVIMRNIARGHFLTGLQFNNEVNFGENTLPDKLHIIVPKDKAQLRKLLDKAISAIDKPQLEYLSNKWFADDDTGSTYSNVVPSDTLIKIAADTDIHGQLVETQFAGETYLAYAAPLTNGKNPLFIGVLTQRKTLVAPFLNQVKLASLITAAFLLLLLPTSLLFANPIVRPVRQLALENDKVRRREFARVVRVDTHVKELNELSESMVNMVVAIQAHELAQRALMDAFIELIGQAIDDKSAYTGGHCKRVPELALMLAEHASASDLPAFRNFELVSDDQWREYRIAAWLHDCGKITTPEHIVDKGSKLETIYNRIHEVRMRFEVLWRDAEIVYWKQLLEAPDQQAQQHEQLQQKQQELLDQFAFVACCNVGGESLDQAKLDRLQEIARITWERHFDDRLGLSPMEELRTPQSHQVLPVTERLLSDKPEHIVDRVQAAVYPTEFGINMDIPEHLYNLGEIYNLSVSRGTLTDEDRFKINEHMISTIKMLESLPFPEELKNVPRYASTHHETMKGSGYPRKLAGENLSIPERILAVADIFEALTAADRPYKKAKPVSAAMDIMHKMVLDNHIDRDCFELFVRQKVYIRYAREFLPAEQLDEFDPNKYLQSSPELAPI